MDEKKRIKELEEENAKLREENKRLKEDPSNEFYVALVDGVKYLTKELKSKNLNLDGDTFAQSVVTLSEKSPKIFDGLMKGRESFEIRSSDVKQSKRRTKVEGEAL